MNTTAQSVHQAAQSPARTLIVAALRLVLLPSALGVAMAIGLQHLLRPVDIAEAPPLPPPAQHDTIILRLRLPGTHAGIPEPLLVAGQPGHAIMGFIRLLPESKARTGLEFWSRELVEGAEFELPAADGAITVTFELPHLLTQQAGTPQTFRILVDREVRLEGVIDYPMPADAPLYLGHNPLGGSFVSSRFTGSFEEIPPPP